MALVLSCACSQSPPEGTRPEPAGQQAAGRTPGRSDAQLPGDALPEDGAVGALDAALAALDASVNERLPSADAGRDAKTAGKDAGTDALGPVAPDGGADSAVAIPPPAAVGCVTDVSPGVHRFPCDATVHTVSVPAQCTEMACGVIVDVHGGMMSSQMQDKNTNLRELGRQHGYIVIQPNASQNLLLLNQRLFVADSPDLPGDDTRVMNILKQVMEAFHVDDKRVHMTGFSEGGFMTWRWLCAHSDLLASVAPAAAAWQCANLANLGLTPPEVGCPMTGDDVPARNIPGLYMQGMQDGLVDPQCADQWVRGSAFEALQLDSGVVVAGDPSSAGAAYVRTRHEDPNGVPFEYIQHSYTSDASFLGVGLLGHCYPGSTDFTPTPPAQTVVPPDQLMAFGCKGAVDFHWGEEVVRFFKAHPKP